MYLWGHQTCWCSKECSLSSVKEEMKWRTYRVSVQCHLPFTGVGEAHEGQVVTRERRVGGRGHGLLEEKPQHLGLAVTESPLRRDAIKGMGEEERRGSGRKRERERECPQAQPLVSSWISLTRSRSWTFERFSCKQSARLFQYGALAWRFQLFNVLSAHIRGFNKCPFFRPKHNPCEHW